MFGAESAECNVPDRSSNTATLSSSQTDFGLEFCENGAIGQIIFSQYPFLRLPECLSRDFLVLESFTVAESVATLPPSSRPHTAMPTCGTGHYAVNALEKIELVLRSR